MYKNAQTYEYATREPYSNPLDIDINTITRNWARFFNIYLPKLKERWFGFI